MSAFSKAFPRLCCITDMGYLAAMVPLGLVIWAVSCILFALSRLGPVKGTLRCGGKGMEKCSARWFVLGLLKLLSYLV